MALVLVGCGDDVGWLGSSELCPEGDGSAAAIEVLLTDDVPVNYEAAPDGDEVPGPTNLCLAAALVGDPEEEAVLAGLGFRRGYQRLWYDLEEGMGDLTVSLYEFSDPEGAAGYVRHTKDRLLSPSWGFTEIDVDDLAPEAVALLQESPVPGAFFIAMILAVGPFSIEIGAYGELPSETREVVEGRARRLLETQVSALP